MKFLLVTCLKFVTTLIVHSPFYPHWLDFRNKRKGNEELYPFFKGVVLEVGAGNGERKKIVLASNPKVKKYIVSDYSSWDAVFDKHNKMINSLGVVTQELYGVAKDDTKLDLIADALNLPLKSNSIDTHCSFEVLEHIADAHQYFKEANRVLKKNGLLIIGMPFLYRQHITNEFDFHRFTIGGFTYLAERHGFKVEKAITYSHLGTTIAILVNQFLIRKIMEGTWLVKILLFPIAPFVFFITNSLGFFLELFDTDDRFSPRYHMVMRKIADKN